MSIPILKQLPDLTDADMAAHPSWVCGHTADYDEPWYDDCDDETYRPWSGALPASAGEEILLVRAEFTLACGACCPGAFHPAGVDWDEPLTRRTKGGGTVRLQTISERHGGSPVAILRIHQPFLFLNGQQHHFWGGLRGVAQDRRQALYQAAGHPPEDVFPIRFSAEPGLVTGITAGQVEGFYRAPAGAVPVVEF